jgi:predicted amidohydrolase YtcJ
MKLKNLDYWQSSADLIATNGKVVTVDNNFSIAQAVAVKEGKIIAVGSDRDIKKLSGSSTQVIDLKGKTILPGINDAHAHIADWSACRPPLAIDISYPIVKSIADIVEKVSQKYQETKKGEWIKGFDWDAGYLKECQADSRRVPVKADLDYVAPDVPVILTEYSGHRIWVNSKALEMAGINQNTLDPIGGKIGRNAGSAEPDGLLYDKATNLVNNLIPAMTKEQAIFGLMSGIAELNSLGITSFTDGGSNHDLWALYNDVYNDSFNKGKWTCRVNLLLTLTGAGNFGPSLTSAPEEISQALNYIGCRHNFGNEWLRIAGAKIVADGIPPLKTAWMYEQYLGGGTGVSVVKGANEDEQEKNLREMIRILHKNRFQIGVHSCGERSVAVCYDQFMKCIKEDPWDARHYNIHSDFARLETIKKIGEFNKLSTYQVGMNVQSAIKWTIADFMIDIVGSRRTDYMWPLRTMLDAGIHVTDSSDAHVTYPNFLRGIQSAVLRESKATGKVVGKEQSITVREAIINYTINGAWQDHQEKIKGSIEVGKLADFCVLDGDILTIEPHHITDIKNVMTVVGGKVVYNIT